MVRKTSAEYSRVAREKYKNDDKYRLMKLLQQAKIRAKKRNLICDLSIKDLLDLFPQDRKCPVLDIDLFWGSSGRGNRWNSPSIDRIDQNGNYTKDNIVIISWRANKIKGDCSIDELEAVLDFMKS